MREKDTNSELNSFDDREQEVVIANLYWQDFLWKGYTAQWSFHANLDHGGTHYDRNGNLVRPAPIGTVREHDVNAYYVGWAGDGHIGRVNLSHASRSPGETLQRRRVARGHQRQMAALKFLRLDWMRYKASFFYASGDAAPRMARRRVDTILDNPNFTGGPFSYWTRQGFNLGDAGELKQRGSLVRTCARARPRPVNFVNRACSSSASAQRSNSPRCARSSTRITSASSRPTRSNRAAPTKWT
jgi:hypothetical protein